MCRWWTTASRIIYGFGWGDRREGSSEDPLPGRARRIKRYAGPTPNIMIGWRYRRLADAIVGARYCHTERCGTALGLATQRS